MIWPFSKKNAWPKDGRPEGRMTDSEIQNMEDPECGFYIHMVPLGGTGDNEAYANAHTHGIPESHPGQLDLQLVVNVGEESTLQIFWDFYRRIRDGERFGDGDRVTEILKQPVLLKKVREGHPDRGEVLRILLPARGDPPTLPGDEGHPDDHFPLQATLDTENLPWGDAPSHDEVPECST